MDVGAVGTGSPNQLNPLVRPAPAPDAVGSLPSLVAGLSEDSIATLLQNLASPQISELLGRMEQARLTQDPMLLEGLLRTAVAAVHAQDLPAAIAAMTELVTLHPERGAQLLNHESFLTPIRGEVKDLLQRLTVSAKLEAEHTLAAASLAIETGASNVAHADGLEPRDLLAIAQRFFDSGLHINFVRASELGQIICSYYFVPAIDVNAPGALREKTFVQQSSASDPFPGKARPLRTALQRLKALWRRAPVLVLLTGWFSVGLAGGFIALMVRKAGSEPVNPTALGIWAIAFLVLVVFQVFATIRKPRL